jgi:PAS domain S-box-containing protein
VRESDNEEPPAQQSQAAELTLFPKRSEDERFRTIEEERRRLEKRLELQRLVHDFSSRMRSERDQEAICRILTEAVSTLTSFRNAFVLLLDEEGEMLRGLHVSGHRRTIEIGTRLSRYSFPKIRLPLRDHPAYSRALKDGEVIYHRTREDIVDTLATLSGLNPGILEIIRRTTRMNLGITVPLYVGDRTGGITPLGIMGISSTQTEVDPEEMGVVITLADQASLALLNVQLIARLGKQVERAEESEARIRRLIDNAHDLICVFDTSGRISYSNNAFRDSELGVAPEFFSQEAVQGLHPVDQPRVVQMLLDLYGGASVQGFDYRIRGRDGEWRHHNLNAVPVSAEGAEVHEVVCFIRDMTPEKHREEQVIRRNTELEILNNLISNLSSTLNLDEVIASSLSMIADFTGAEALALFVVDGHDDGRLETLGQLWFPKELAERLHLFPEGLGSRGLPSRDRVAVIEDIAVLPPDLATMARGAGITCALTVPVQTHGTFTGYVLAASKSPFVLDDEHMAVLRAVGEQLGLALESSRLFREVERSSVEAERRRREVEFYMDLMGHDISNLTQSALATLESLLEDVRLPPDARERVGAALSQVSASAAVISKVKTLSSLQHEAGPPDLRGVDLVDAVRRCADLARGAGGGRTVVVEVDAPGRAWVRADDLLEQLVQNLLGNAVKHTQGDRVRVEVTVAGAQLDGEDAWLLSVADAGPGIQDDRKLELLEGPGPGPRAGRRRGLGLTIVKAIANRYGARVWVEDRVKGEPARGAVFKALLMATAPPGPGDASKDR